VRVPVFTTRFARDLERMRRRGKDAETFKTVARLLLAGEALPRAHRDHPLKGKFSGWRDCHLAPDWVLIYRIDDDQVVFGRTGTHSDLFG
jgi:mRNA interferase YafQ